MRGIIIMHYFDTYMHEIIIYYFDTYIHGIIMYNWKKHIIDEKRILDTGMVQRSKQVSEYIISH